MNPQKLISCLIVLLAIVNPACVDKSWTKKSIVLQTEAMNEVIKRNVVYDTNGGKSLSMDVYYPKSMDSATNLPVVILVLGISDTPMLKYYGTKLKDVGQYTSWAELIASSGLAAVTYETVDPAVDIRKVIQFIRTNANTLRIDANAIAFWSCSGNSPMALAQLTGETKEYLRCMVIYYGYMIEIPGTTKVAEQAKLSGFTFPAVLSTAEKLRWDVPMFFVRAGLDNPVIHESQRAYTDLAKARNAPIEQHDLPYAHHAFDVADDNDTSRVIINQTVDFMKRHLSGN